MGVKSEAMKALMLKIRGFKNKYSGSTFESFLKEEKIEEIVNQKSIQKTQKIIRKRIRLKK